MTLCYVNYLVESFFIGSAINHSARARVSIEHTYCYTKSIIDEGMYGKTADATGAYLPSK